MGNLPQNEAAAEAIVALEKVPATNLIRTWNEVPVVPPEVLRDWMNEVVATLLQIEQGIVEGAPEIRDDKVAQRLQAHAILTHCQEFLKLAHRNGNLLDDEAPPIISQAFAQGLRLGMVFQNLQVVAKEAYLDRWKRDDNIEGSVDKRRKEADRLRTEAEEALSRAAEQFPNSGVDFQKKQAAKALGIGKRALNNRLKDKS